VNARGFTLLEVILAVSLSGLSVLVGALLWRQSLAASVALTNHRAVVDGKAGARRWLQSAIGSIEVGAEGDVPFMGHPDRVSFSTWLPTADGWQERHSVTIAADGGRFAVDGFAGTTLLLADSVARVAFDYLLEPGLNSQWASTWESPVSAPLAIRIRIIQGDLRADTLLFLVGGRG
jgi:prepilin-type N-terminal cleavage/methylation domain-containing protein